MPSPGAVRRAITITTETERLSIAKRRGRGGRNVSGILLLDKSEGVTSNAALQTVKRLFAARKAGHTGSLDPLATGLLPLCFGEATKLSGFLLDSDKRYWVRIQLGIKTTTGDAEGEVVQTRPVPALDAATVKSAMARFEGTIDQIPPMHSALKRNGQPLYKLAHQGIEVEREPRQVTVFDFELVALDKDVLEVDIRCSKGTYVRTLAEDLGEVLGCGAHVSALRRTAVGIFDVAQAHTLDALQQVAEEGGTEGLDGLLLPMELALAGWPGLTVSDDLAYFLSRGQPVQVPQSPTRGWVRLYRGDQRFLGVGRILDDGRVSPKRLVRNAG